MSSWQEILRRRNAQQQQKTGFQTLPYVGTILGISSSDETSSVQTPQGILSLQTRHPYMGTSSWIRVMPQPGTSVLLQKRADGRHLAILGYRSDNNSTQLQAFDSGLSVRRPLEPGEVDVMSAGVANIFFSRAGQLELRGGISRMWLSQRNLETGMRATLHRRELHGKTFGLLGDEERFGVVRRVNVTNPLQQKTVKTSVLGVPTFAKEYLRVLQARMGVVNYTLVDYREGHVTDDLGLPVLGNFGAPLRVRARYQGAVLGNYTDVTIDELGNVAIQTPPTAINGISASAPTGNIQLSAGLQGRMEAVLNIFIRAGMKTTVQGTLGVDLIATLPALSPLAGVVTGECCCPFIASVHPDKSLWVKAQKL